MKHVVRSQQFDLKTIEEIFSIADRLDKVKQHTLNGKILATLFYEPSTRTRLSFESAMIRLGGSVISTENAREFSSAIKGETLEDSIKVVSNYADIIVLRHYKRGASKQAASVSKVPIINAGDGAGQHPTQALLDLYTIKKELGKVDGICVAIAGDLKHGRTVRSLAYLLGKYQNVKIIFIAPPELRIGDDIKEYLHRHNIDYEENESLASIVTSADVLYQTRIQKERSKNQSVYDQLNTFYQVDQNFVRKMKKKSIIMHPLPRVSEILPEVDSDPRAVYFKQARYGLSIRMALLAKLLNKAS